MNVSIVLPKGDGDGEAWSTAVKVTETRGHVCAWHVHVAGGRDDHTLASWLPTAGRQCHTAVQAQVVAGGGGDGGFLDGGKRERDHDNSALWNNEI